MNIDDNGRGGVLFCDRVLITLCFENVVECVDLRRDDFFFCASASSKFEHNCVLDSGLFFVFVLDVGIVECGCGRDVEVELSNGGKGG